MACCEIYKLLDKGTYRTVTGARRPIAGDMTKLRFAEEMKRDHKLLFANFRFRSSVLPGTQEIRTKIGHVCVWTSMYYGNGIFMTVSPGELHNYLAIRLSRYRAADPYVDNVRYADEIEWIGSSMCQDMI